MRRSTRNIDKNHQASTEKSPEDEYEDVQMEDIVDDSEEEKEKTKPKKRARATKRKTAVNANENPAPVKRARGTRGTLKEVLQMPVDVLVEIFGCLNPVDLLNLTWTTKEFRSLLLTKNSDSRAIWRASFSNIPGMPKCPEDMSEPRYAHLAFIKVCHCCNKKIPSITIIWYARVRLCRRCIEQEFGRDANGTLPWKLCGLVPSYELPIRKGRFYEGYHYKTASSWKEQYLALKDEDKQEWLNSKIELQTRLKQHAEACEAWLVEYEVFLAAEKNSMIDARKKFIVGHLEKLGWAEEISKIQNPDDYPEELAIVIKACQKDITDKILSNLEPGLIEHMELVQKSRLKKECEELVEKRLPLLKEVYEAYVDTLPANSIYPGIADVFLHPDVMSIMKQNPEVELTLNDFCDIRSSLPDIFREMRTKIEERMIALIPANFIPEGVNGPEILNLATISFKCNSYPCQIGLSTRMALRYPEVLCHPCATSSPGTYLTEPMAVTFDGLSMVGKALHTVSWNGLSRIEFDEQAFTTIADAVTMCGRDPLTTTSDEMNAECPLFECLNCHDKYTGRVILPWHFLPGHKRIKHSSLAVVDVSLLEEPDASIAKARLLEAKLRACAEKTFDGMICMHCKKVGNSIDLAEHIKTEHKFSNVTEKDIARRVAHNGSGGPPNIFCLWPPREVPDAVPASTA